MKKSLEKMSEDLKLRGTSPGTTAEYQRCIRKFMEFHNSEPEKLDITHIRKYHLHLANERKLAASTINVHMSAIRFLYCVTLGRDYTPIQIPNMRKKKKVPVVLSGQETILLLCSIENLKHRVLAATIYSSGLRVGEAVNLKASDIDSQRMLIHVRKSKGNKERLAILSSSSLDMLRQYWVKCSDIKKYWLFPGDDPKFPISRRSVQKIMGDARKKAGINKHVTPHTLRHCFATHLYELGVDIVLIQKLMGHSSLRSTTLYTHIASYRNKKIRSPFDVIANYIN